MSDAAASDKIEFCSFCGCHAADCTHFFRGPATGICGECVLQALDVMLHGWPTVDEEMEARRQAEKEAERAKPWLETQAVPAGAAERELNSGAFRR